MSQNTNEVELTILMPCLNEAETLEVCIKKAFHFLEEYHVDGEDRGQRQHGRLPGDRRTLWSPAGTCAGEGLRSCADRRL